MATSLRYKITIWHGDDGKVQTFGVDIYAAPGGDHIATYVWPHRTAHVADVVADCERFVAAVRAGRPAALAQPSLFGGPAEPEAET